MLPPPPSTFPTELLIEIMKRSDCSTLHQFALTGRAFTPLALPLYYATMDFRVINETNLHSWFRESLAVMINIPEVAGYVRHLSLSVDCTWKGGPVAQIFDNPTFLRCMKLFSQSANPPSALSLENIPFENIITQRLTQTFFSTSLVNLSLQGCTNVPFTIFLICPNLRNVVLVKVEYQSDLSKKPTKEERRLRTQMRTRPAPALERLEFQQSELFIDALLNPPPLFPNGCGDLSRLKVLRACPDDVELIEHIVERAAPTLEELLLLHRGTALRDHFIPFRYAFSLRPLTRLRIISLRLYICDSDIRGNGRVISELTRIFSTIPARNSIAQINLEFVVYTFTRDHPVCRYQDWCALANALVRVGEDTSAAAVHVTIRFELNIVGRGYFKEPHDSRGQAILYGYLQDALQILWESPSVRMIFEMDPAIEV